MTASNYKEMRNGQNWCCKMDTNECCLIMYSLKNRIINFAYHINNSNTCRCPSIEDLDVLFDSKFSFANHIYF